MTATALIASTDPWSTAELGTCPGIPVAIGGELTPHTLLGAYRRGIFCQPRSDRASIAENQLTYAPDVDAGYIPVLPGPGNPYAILWWSPSPRYAIPVSEIRIGRTLRKKIRRAGWTTTVNTAFDEVLAHCRADREPHWITDDLVEALHALHTMGWVHSVEVWHREQLVGGLYGCAMDTVFTMDSAFHTMTGAAKTAIADLAGRVALGNVQLLDAQVRTEYTVQMGSCPIPREQYLHHLRSGRPTPGWLAHEPRAADALSDPA